MFVGSGNEIRARADLSVGAIQQLGLQVESAEPPPRHANIIGWPAEKDRMMSLAQELAEASTLRVRQ